MNPNAYAIDPSAVDSIVDAADASRYLPHTSLLFVSTAGRGAVSSEAAPAFFARRPTMEILA